MKTSIVAKPGTPLRGMAICALSNEGVAGPNYSLDDISATISLDDDSIHVDFWDMGRDIRKSNKYYKELKTLMENHGRI